MKLGGIMQKKKIVTYKSCLECQRTDCKQDDEQLQICFFYNRKNIKNIDDIFDEQLKDEIKFHILWFLDDEKCSLALTKSKELSQAVEKIIEEIKNSIDK